MSGAACRKILALVGCVHFVPAILPSGSGNAHSSLLLSRRQEPSPSHALEALTSLDERTTPWCQSASCEIVSDSALPWEIMRFASCTSRTEVQRWLHPKTHNFPLGVTTLGPNCQALSSGFWRNMPSGENSVVHIEKMPSDLYLES